MQIRNELNVDMHICIGDNCFELKTDLLGFIYISEICRLMKFDYGYKPTDKESYFSSKGIFIKKGD